MSRIDYGRGARCGAIASQGLGPRCSYYRQLRAQRRRGGGSGWVLLIIAVALLATAFSVTAAAAPNQNIVPTSAAQAGAAMPPAPRPTMVPPQAAAGLTAAALSPVVQVATTALATTTPPTTPPAAPTLALVLQDQTALRGAPREAGATLAQLWRGEVLELRGERLDYAQVWDHRRERGGFVRLGQLHRIGTEPADAPELLALLRFVQHQSGAEALGLGLAAAYIQAASGAQLASADGAAALAILGRLAERLADRASQQSTAAHQATYVLRTSVFAFRAAGQAHAAHATSAHAAAGNASPSAGAGSHATAPSRASEAALAAHLDVAARYGVGFIHHEQEGGRIQVCYEGDAWRRVLALAQDAALRAAAALALTRPDCIAPLAHPGERERLDVRRAQLLDQVDTRGLPAPLAPHLRHRLALRRASVHASLAFAATRRGAWPAVVLKGGTAGATPATPATHATELRAEALADLSASLPAITATATAHRHANRAIAEMAGVHASELNDDDLPAYREAAMRVNAVRWAAALAPAAPNPSNQPTIITQAGEPGQTCVLLLDAQHGIDKPLVKRCTWGVVWMASASRNREGNALALAVQPADGWRELWLLRRSATGWTLAVLPPAPAAPGLGYAEFAGWAPGGQQVLVARESLAEGRYRRHFELMNLDSGSIERQASDASLLGAFSRWADVQWRGNSLSLR